MKTSIMFQRAVRTKEKKKTFPVWRLLLLQYVEAVEDLYNTGPGFNDNGYE